MIRAHLVASVVVMWCVAACMPAPSTPEREALVPLPTATVSLRATTPPTPTQVTATPSLTPTEEYANIPKRIATTPFPTVAMPPQPPADFAFTAGYGTCRVSRIIDTFASTLGQYSIQSEPVTITLRLTEGEMVLIYRQMYAMNILSYPPRYRIEYNDMAVYSAPYPTYQLAVRSEGKQVAITWEDSMVRPSNQQADDFRALIELIQTIVETHEELRQLPPLGEACA